jgi:tetratricopeptide (TPR) repeat protein
MRPPMPELTQRYGSPNACNICHQSRTAAWADSLIQERYQGNYQTNTREWADMLEILRRGSDVNPDSFIALIRKQESDIVSASLLRSLPTERNVALIPLLRELSHSPSALVRSSVFMNLSHKQYPELFDEVLAACADSVRLVRIRAAEALSGIDERYIPSEYRQAYRQAHSEYKASLQLFPDDEHSHYNLGNYYSANSDPVAAAGAYRRALKLRPEFAEAAINLGLLYYETGNTDSAMHFLRKAVNDHPDLPEAQINLALLYSETGNTSLASRHFEDAYNLNSNALSAYNLAILYQQRDLKVALTWAQRAYEAQPGDPAYVYLYVYMLYQHGREKQALKIIQQAEQQGISSPEIRKLYRQLDSSFSG